LYAGGFHFVIYVPQVDRWKKDRIEARAAITLIPTSTSTSLYGIVSLSASLARQGQARDLYAGRSGQVWEHRQDGWYKQDNNGNWTRSKPEPGLESQRQSRSLGQSRTDEFRSFGTRIGGGTPRTLSRGLGGSRGGGRR
jgi:hypothetical protein